MVVYTKKTRPPGSAEAPYARWPSQRIPSSTRGRAARCTRISVTDFFVPLYVAKIHSHRSSRLCPGIAMVETS
jgi:hypothetical protein